MRILFLTNVPSPYRVAFFNELGKNCDLTVVFEKETSDERDKSWKDYSFDAFKGVFLKGKSLSTDTAFCPGVIKYVKDRSYDVIIVSTFSSPTGILAIEYMRCFHIPYWIESDGGSAKSGKGFRETIKKHIIPGAAGYFSTAKEHDNYYLTYGADKDKLHRYPFTSLYASDILSHVVSDGDKAALKSELGLHEKQIVLSVGRFSYQNGYGKGYDAVLRAASRISKDIGFYIVGDEPTDEFLKMRENLKASNVHFVGFKGKEELKKYYQAADLFVLMTVREAWGLVINEAMANGLPVITTDMCVAGLELVKNGENGYIVSVGDDLALETRLNEVLADEAKRNRMAENSLRTIRPYTIENVAAEHIRVFRQYISEKN